MRTTMISNRAGIFLVVAALAAGQTTCHQAILTAPPGSTITVFANPEFISAHGGVSVITAVVIEPSGTPVADGTVVQCFTNLGRIDEQGKTNDGVARMNLVSDSRSGQACVTCISGGPAASTSPTSTTTTTIVASPIAAAALDQTACSVTVAIGSVLPAKVFVTASPQQLTDRRASLITATVVDLAGNPVANVPVIFTVAGAFEFVDSQGSPTFTDNNGQAQDVMRTRYDPSATQRAVIVTATAANGVNGTVTVTIN
jgi:hypothetical protein